MTAANPYLLGNYAPVGAEETVTGLPVTGPPPSGLNGRYLRNGPNPVTPLTRPPTTGSPATGWSMASGSKTARPAGTGTAGSDRRRSPPCWVNHSAGPRSNGWTSLRTQTSSRTPAGRTPSWKRCRPYELTYELGTVGASDFQGTLPGGYTAHPKRDPVTGELHAISYYWAWGNQVQYSVVGVDGRCGGPSTSQSAARVDSRHVPHNQLRRDL